MKPSGLSLLLLVVLISSCGRTPTLPPMTAEDSLLVLHQNALYRAEREHAFSTSPDSPFRTDTGTARVALRWYPVNPRYRVESVLHRYDHPETVTVFGTRGEERRQVRYGFFRFVVPAETGNPRELSINAYTPADAGGDRLSGFPLSVWFTDLTTGRETYHVGRYVEVGVLDPDPGCVYTIDFNMAYNPFCAYNDRYSCAVPRKEDHLDIALRAGELNYHESPE